MRLCLCNSRSMSWAFLDGAGGWPRHQEKPPTAKRKGLSLIQPQATLGFALAQAALSFFAVHQALRDFAIKPPRATNGS